MKSKSHIGEPDPISLQDTFSETFDGVDKIQKKAQFEKGESVPVGAKSIPLWRNGFKLSPPQQSIGTTSYKYSQDSERTLTDNSWGKNNKIGSDISAYSYD